MKKSAITEKQENENVTESTTHKSLKRKKKNEAKSSQVLSTESEKENVTESEERSTTKEYRFSDTNNNNNNNDSNNNILLHIKMKPDERVTDHEIVSMVLSDDDDDSSFSGESYYSIESKFEVLTKTCSVYRWNIEQFQCKLFSGLDLYSMPFKLTQSGVGGGGDKENEENSNTFELKMTWFDKRKNKIKVELLENGVDNTNGTQNRYRIFLTCEGNGFFNSQSLTVNALHCEPFLYVNHVNIVDVTEACNSKTIGNFIENNTLFMNCYFELV